VCRSRHNEKPFAWGALQADADPTIPLAFLHSPFLIRDIHAGHTFCPSFRLPLVWFQCTPHSGHAFLDAEISCCSAIRRFATRRYEMVR
jgi:hypothetical protein